MVEEVLVQKVEKAIADADPFVADVLDSSELRALALAAVATAEEAHQARVAELLEANNREVERRRAAETRVAELEGFIVKPPRHVYWNAGEPDCPPDIKAGNGELHTLRCKNCGEENPRGPAICRATIIVPQEANHG